MKKAFTLLELLIVTVVISLLLSVTIRFGNVSDDQSRRAKTVDRMQRLENALSGYYAAFGTYPPVKLHNSRNYLLEVSDHGIQNIDGNENQSLWGWCNSDGKVTNVSAEDRAWRQVKAACEAQPVGCYFPYEDDDAFRNYVASYSDALKSYAASADNLSSERKAVLSSGFDTGVPLGRFGYYRNKTEWSEVQLFRFGVLSYLLPRYLFMTTGPEELLRYAQWTGNNDMPRDPLRGTEYTGGWTRLRQDAKSLNQGDQARVANIPSQAVCARWMPNFESSLVCAKENLTLFGINVKAEDWTGREMNEESLNPNIPIFSPGGYSQSSTSGQYVLNSVTMQDGWGNELFYYSPAPYQSYVVWSAGPNGRTFPPWVAREKLGADANRCIGYWISDDIVGLSH